MTLILDPVSAPIILKRFKMQIYVPRFQFTSRCILSKRNGIFSYPPPFFFENGRKDLIKIPWLIVTNNFSMNLQ